MNNTLNVLECNIAYYFNSLFVFRLALRNRRNAAKLVKIHVLNDATQ